MIEDPCNQDFYSEAPIMNSPEFYSKTNFIYIFAAIHNFFLIFKNLFILAMIWEI